MAQPAATVKAPKAQGTVYGGRLRLGAVLRFGLIGLYTLFLIAPLYWVIVTSIKPTDDYLQTPPVWFPDEPTSIHYSVALNDMRGWTAITNSIVIASFVTVISVVVGAWAGYSMARFNTGGKHLAFWILSQRFLAPIAVIIPIFLMYRNAPEWIGITLIDKRLGLILLYTVFVLPFTIWMMFAYFRQMPVELEEASLVDGCSRWQALWRIALPLAAPGIVSAGAFAFIFSFTEFLFALVLTSREAVTLPVVISGMSTSFQGALYGESSALTMVSLVPAIVLGILVQRHLVRGLTLGAVQG